MLRKRILSLMVLLMTVATPLLAQSTPVDNDDESNAYRVYEVKKGDTLWGISRKFIEDPYYWPDLWANNPEIQNPHFIYPGQKLNIYSAPITVVGITNEVEPVVPVAGEPPAPVVPPSEPAPVAIAPGVPAEEVVTISVPAGLSFISESEEASRGTIVDFTAGRYFSASGDTVFVLGPENSPLRIGDRLNILKSRGEIIHPRTKKVLGFQVDQLGTLEVTALGKDLQTAVIRKNYREIERGAWLTPRRAVREQIALRRAESDLNGIVVATSSDKELQGKSDVLFIDFGAKSGLKVGNLLTMTRTRQATDLAVFTKKELTAYPEELIGYALVVETKDETATAVILKSLAPAMVGDRVWTQTGKPTL